MGEQRPIAFLIPQGMEPKYVDRFMAQTSGSLLLLNLFQTDPPVFSNQSDLKSIEHVESYCRGRFLLTKKKAMDLAELLRKHVEKMAVEE